MTSPRYIRPISERFIIEQLSDGSVAVFDRAGDAVHSLNPAAAAVWTCCTEPSTIDDLCDAVPEGTVNPPGVDAIEAAVRQLLAVGLLQEVQGVSAALPLAALSSRRQALKKLARGGVVALPVVLTLVGKEQRLLAQGSGSPTVNLAGCWSGQGVEDDDVTQLNITQSGNTITGTSSSEDSTGTLTGTISGTTLNVVLNITVGGVCSGTGTFTSTNVTTNAFSGSLVVDFQTSMACQDLSGLHFEDTVSFTRGCVPA